MTAVKPGAKRAGALMAGLFLLAPCPRAAAEQEERTAANSVLKVEVGRFSSEIYADAVERLIAAYETKAQDELVPGSQGKVGLKVYTNAGPGLSTPVGLVRGVLAALERRGFEKEDVFLIDLSERRLRAAGFLPSLREGGTEFDGHPVYVLDSGDYYDSDWYYDSALPPQREPRFAPRPGAARNLDEDRRSYLPVPLLLDVDFWINLPVYSELPALGLNGALVNATLWNASNTLRFLHSEASGPAAVAEMAAIPELAESWVFTIASLERFQFAGGPRFHSLYTGSKPEVVLSADPVLLDAYMVGVLNERRERRGLQPLEELLPILDYASQLRMGDPFFSESKMRELSLEDAAD